MKKAATIKSSLSNPYNSVTSQRFFEPMQCCMQISCFFGSEDYITGADWINLYDMITTDYNWTATSKCIRLPGYLRKHALAYFVQMIKVYPIEQTPWETIKELFARRYTPQTNRERDSPSRSANSSASSASDR